MKNHRILPLIFALAFAFFAPLLVLRPAINQHSSPGNRLASFLEKTDRRTIARLDRWHNELKGTTRHN